jgi:hypothetical protein
MSNLLLVAVVDNPIEVLDRILPSILKSNKKQLNHSEIQAAEKVPSGKYQGKDWKELTEAQLKAALICCHPEFSEAHREAIKAELKRRADSHLK